MLCYISKPGILQQLDQQYALEMLLAMHVKSIIIVSIVSYVGELAGIIEFRDLQLNPKWIDSLDAPFRARAGA